MLLSVLRNLFLFLFKTYFSTICPTQIYKPIIINNSFSVTFLLLDIRFEYRKQLNVS
jgi:hypothetical protein